VREREPGELEAKLRVGASFEGRREVRVTASAPRAGISGTRALPLRPGEVAAARFDEEDGVIRGDDHRPALLRVSVADRHGNPVDVAPAVSAARGKVLGVAAAGPGAFEVRYAAPAVAEPMPERLVASVGSLRAAADRVLLPPGPRLALAAAPGLLVDVRGRFAGARVGVAAEKPADLAPALRRGLEVSLHAEASALQLRSGAAAGFLAGAVASRALGASAVLRAGAAGGVHVRSGGTSPAARLFAGAAGRGRSGPFLELDLLAAGSGAPGAFAALGLSAGIRFGVERTHGDDPHRR
jgi:hypothetical protein